MDLSTWTREPWTFALLVPALWIGFSLGISTLGWAQAAAGYACEGHFPERRFRYQSAGFRRGAGYNLGVTFGVDADALYLRTASWLRIGHPPLRIPWSDVTPRSVRAGWVERVDLELAATPKATLRITPALARRLAEAAGGHWPAGRGLTGGRLGRP
ncbi:MAG: hypothetical protein ACQGVK_19600 [Myxococcota bacterium]